MRVSLLVSFACASFALPMENSLAPFFSSTPHKEETKMTSTPAIARPAVFPHQHVQRGTRSANPFAFPAGQQREPDLRAMRGRVPRRSDPIGIPGSHRQHPTQQRHSSKWNEHRSGLSTMHRGVNSGAISSGWFVEDIDLEVGSSPDSGISRIHRHPIPRSQRPPLKPPARRSAPNGFPVERRHRETSQLEKAIEGLSFDSDDEDYMEVKNEVPEKDEAAIAIESDASGSPGKESRLSSSFSEWISVESRDS